MDELQCEICVNWYNEDDRRPKNLPCGHSYCSSCMTKELEVGRRTCPTCRRPHNANSVEDLPISVTLERMIRNMPKKLSLETNSSDSEDEDYSGGPCSKHKKSVTYFYCLTHSLQICRECTVINHQMGKCEIISIEEQIGKKKDVDISQASSTRNDIEETLAALGKLVKENQDTISDEEIRIQKLKKLIEDATKIIAQKKTANEDARRVIANGQINGTNIDAAKRRLKNAKSQKNISRCSIDVRSSQTIIVKWIQDVQSKFEIQLVNVKSPAPADILENISKGQTIHTETTIKGTKAIAVITSKNNKIHVHPFKQETPQKGSIAYQYEQLIGLVRKNPPTLLFMDLKHNSTTLGRIYMRIQPEINAFVKHVPALFLGNNGTSILSNSCWSAAGSFNLGIQISHPVNDVTSRKPGLGPTQYGEVICSFLDGSIKNMLIYIDDSKPYNYGSTCTKIGCIEAGLEVAVNARALGKPEQDKITISDCGLVFD